MSLNANIAATAKTLATEVVDIDADCIGERWTTADEKALAQLIAIVTMGQAIYAGYILTNLAPIVPQYSDAQLRTEARIRLTVEEPAKKPKRGGYPRWQRDGLIFEAISWLAARQAYPGVLLMAPHVSATSQGLDGLMIELKGDKSGIQRTTIFEDKCSDEPQKLFAGKVIAEFKKRHNNERSAEIISAATTLIMTSGVDEVTATKFAAAVTDRTLRRYRASFAVTVDNQDERKKLFAGYNKIDNISQTQRVGASLVVPPKMRDWFDKLAKLAVEYLNSLEKGNS